MIHLRSEIMAMRGYEFPTRSAEPSSCIKLDTNENPYECSPLVTKAVNETLRQGLRCYPDPTAREFRETAGEVLGIDPNWILCGNGSDDILSVSLRGFMTSGQAIRVMSPSYKMYDSLATLNGLRVERLEYNPDWTIPRRFDFPTAGLGMAILANPNSPTGTVLSAEEIGSIAERIQCPLLIDEAYAELAGISCIPLVEKYSNILISRSMSKSYSLAGIRFGYLIAHPTIIEHLSKVKDPYNCDSLSVSAASAAIKDTEWLVDNTARIRGTRERFQAELETLGFDIAPSNANFLWCQHPKHCPLFLFEELKREQIFVRYLDYGHCEGLRIAVGTDQQMTACANSLRSIIHRVGNPDTPNRC